MASYPPVQSVVRAFGLLRELNQRNVSTVDHLHKVTRLPKPTIVRLLETLIGEGLVMSDKRLGGYCVTSSVRALSAGYHDAPLIVEAARAPCAAFTRAHKWPLSVAVLEGSRMVVRFSTIPDSALSPLHATLNMTLELLSTAHGQAYLAFCPDKEREALLRMVSARKGGESRGGTSERAVRETIARVRRQGHAERAPAQEARSATIALAVRHADRVLGTVGMTYFIAAVSQRDRAGLLSPLRACVADIQRGAAELIRQREVDP